MTKEYKPTVSGRASICDWELKFAFLTKEQCQKFIDEYFKTEFPINFKYYTITSHGSGIDDYYPEQHVVELSCSWAFNLKKVAKLLEKVDYWND